MTGKVIIQARMGSTRLPGKVLLKLGGKPALWHVVNRCREFKSISSVIVTTGTNPEDDAIEAYSQQIGALCFRGSENDVLARFAATAREYPADYYVRVTADCPLIDPDTSSKIISNFEQANVDYASNKIPQSFPRGLDTEVFTAAALDRAHREASRDHERIHVTPYMYRPDTGFSNLSVTDDIDRSEWRWTLDTEEDLEFLRQIYERLGSNPIFKSQTVYELLENEPELKFINSHVRQKRIEEG